MISLKATCTSVSSRTFLYTLLILFCFFITGCKDDKKAGQKYPPAPVSVSKAELKNTPYYLPAIGTVKAIDSITVRSRITGYLSKIFIKNGEYVKKGQQLFTMDPSPYEASIRQFKAQLASDKTKYEQTKRDYNRYRDLVKRKVVSEENFEQKRLDMKTASDAIAVTQAQLNNARNDLNYCFIRSPIDGLAGYINPTEGNLIEENKDELVVINKISPIAVDFYLPQKYLPEVQNFSANSTLEVTAITEGSSIPEKGALSFIDNNVDIKTGTIWMQGTFKNNDRILWPGNYVTIRLKLYEEKVIQVPMQATCSGPEGKFIWVMNQNKTVDMHPVTVNRRSGKVDIITKGLKDQATIVIDGQLRLFPGAPVTVKSPHPMSSASKDGNGE